MLNLYIGYCQKLYTQHCHFLYIVNLLITELLPTQISAWKAQALQNFDQVFSGDKPDKKEKSIDVEKLYSQIGQLKVVYDFLKKKLQ